MGSEGRPRNNGLGWLCCWWFKDVSELVHQKSLVYFLNKGGRRLSAGAAVGRSRGVPFCAVVQRTPNLLRISLMSPVLVQLSCVLPAEPLTLLASKAEAVLVVLVSGARCTDPQHWLP